MENLYVVVGSGNVQPGQLVPVEHEGQITIVRVLRFASREDYINHNPKTWQQDFESLSGQELTFWETETFAGRVVLVLPNERQLGSIAHNAHLGSWKILSPATPGEYVQSLQEFGGHLAGNQPVLDAIRSLLASDSGDVYFYWATPFQEPTQKIRFSREELDFLDRLLEKWTHTSKDAQDVFPNGQTHVIVKIREALGKFPQSDPPPFESVEVIIEEHELDRVH